MRHACLDLDIEAAILRLVLHARISLIVDHFVSRARWAPTSLHPEARSLAKETFPHGQALDRHHPLGRRRPRLADRRADAGRGPVQGISGLFGCEGSGKKQEGGALIGGAAGALVGRAISKDNKTLGTVLGAAAGAAAGAYIGCRMQSTDQAMAQQATKRALDSGRSETWSNSRTGASGRIDVVSSSYGPPISGDSLRFERGVTVLRSYDAVGADYTARSTANLRSGPRPAARWSASWRPASASRCWAARRTATGCWWAATATASATSRPRC